MGIIWFNVKEAYEYLMRNGEIYTLRDHPKYQGKAMLKSSLEGKPFYKGMVNVEFVLLIVLDVPMSKANLSRYVGKSGFNTVGEWLSKVPPEANELYLYYVVKKKNA